MSNQQVTPSRMNLQLFKQKILSAKKGHELLKKKCDALKTRFRQVMINLLEYKMKMGIQTQDALLLIAKAQWSAGEFNQKVKDSVKRATIRVDINTDNIAGVLLPSMAVKESDDSENGLAQLGMDRGGQSIQRCREVFRELLDLLVQIASYQTQFISLDQAIKVTSRRVNALEYVVIPRFIQTKDYIDQELDEMSKEDFYRLKKVLQNKRRDENITKVENDAAIVAIAEVEEKDEDEQYKNIQFEFSMNELELFAELLSNVIMKELDKIENLDEITSVIIETGEKQIDKNILSRLSPNAQQLKQQQITNQQKSIEYQLSSCTFKPHISSSTNRIRQIPKNHIKQPLPELPIPLLISQPNVMNNQIFDPQSAFQKINKKKGSFLVLQTYSSIFEKGSELDFLKLTSKEIELWAQLLEKYEEKLNEGVGFLEFMILAMESIENDKKGTGLETFLVQMKYYTEDQMKILLNNKIQKKYKDILLGEM